MDIITYALSKKNAGGSYESTDNDDVIKLMLDLELCSPISCQDDFILISNNNVIYVI